MIALVAIVESVGGTDSEQAWSASRFPIGASTSFTGSVPLDTQMFVSCDKDLDMDLRREGVQK